MYSRLVSFTATDAATSYVVVGPIPPRTKISSLRLALSSSPTATLKLAPVISRNGERSSAALKAGTPTASGGSADIDGVPALTLIITAGVPAQVEMGPIPSMLSGPSYILLATSVVTTGATIQGLLSIVIAS